MLACGVSGRARARAAGTAEETSDARAVWRSFSKFSGRTASDGRDRGIRDGMD